MIFLALTSVALAILCVGILIGIWIAGEMLASDEQLNEWRAFGEACEEMLRG